MEGIPKSNKQTPESTKSILEMRERQDKTETLKFVKKIRIGLPLSPKQFKEFDGLFLHRPSNIASKL